MLILWKNQFQMNMKEEKETEKILTGWKTIYRWTGSIQVYKKINNTEITV